MTATEQEKVVREYWNLTAECDGSYRGYSRGTVLIQDVNHHWFDFPDWSAAYAYTLDHQQKRAELESQIKTVMLFIDGRKDILRMWESYVVIGPRELIEQHLKDFEAILARLQSLLEQHMRGVRTEKGE